MILHSSYCFCVLCCLLRYLPGELHHCVPRHLSVVEDKASDMGKGLGTSRAQGHSCQGVGAQVQELQVGDAGHNFADLKMMMTMSDVCLLCCKNKQPTKAQNLTSNKD